MIVNAKNSWTRKESHEEKKFQKKKQHKNTMSKPSHLSCSSFKHPMPTKKLEKDEKIIQHTKPKTLK